MKTTPKHRRLAVVTLLRAHDDMMKKEQALYHAITYALDLGLTRQEVIGFLQLSNDRRNVA